MKRLFTSPDLLHIAQLQVVLEAGAPGSTIHLLLELRRREALMLRVTTGL